jgi:hypothetical protein
LASSIRLPVRWNVFEDPPMWSFQTVSVFRRPLITVNIFFDSSVLWEGRQNLCVATTLAPGPCPSGAAHFMTGIFTSMTNVRGAGNLTDSGAVGGPQFLANMASGKRTPPCVPLVEFTIADVPCATPSGPATPPVGRSFIIFIPFLPANLQARAKTPAGIQAIFAFCASPSRFTISNPGEVAIACGESIFDNRPINYPAVPRDPTAVSGSFGSTAPPGPGARAATRRKTWAPTHVTPQGRC